MIERIEEVPKSLQGEKFGDNKGFNSSKAEVKTLRIIECLWQSVFIALRV